MPAKNENQEPQAWMEHRLLAWLSGPGPRSTQLERWLQGYDLSVLDAEEEPYVWLLRGLPQEDRHRWESGMAAEVADLVGQQPDVEPRGRRPPRLLYNLLMLAAGLSATTPGGLTPGILWRTLSNSGGRRPTRQPGNRQGLPSCPLGEVCDGWLLVEEELKGA